MEIINARKETMMVAEFTMFVMLTLINSVSTAQQLEGEYIGNDGIIYQFKDSIFKTITRMHVGNEIATGLYKISNDTLYLHFRPFANPPNSHFKFSKRKKHSIPLGRDSTSRDTTSINVKFNIFNYKSQPLEGAILLLHNKSDHTVMVFTSDSLGNYPSLSIFEEYIKQFEFTYLGKEPMRINADTLAGYNANVQVILSSSDTYSKFNGTKKYVTKEVQKTKLILKSIENDIRIVLEREGAE